jgi:hypothetical protein
MSLEGISSKGSLRFDEFPTSMKATQSFSGLRATRLLAYENARPSESRCSPLRGEHARTPPSAFPFLHITMSKSRWACSRATLPNPRWKQIPHLESTTVEASREDRANSASVRKDRAVAFSPAGDASPRAVHLRSGFRLVKGCPRKAVKSFFLGFVITRPHSCPIAPTVFVR